MGAGGGVAGGGWVGVGWRGWSWWSEVGEGRGGSFRVVCNNVVLRNRTTMFSARFMGVITHLFSEFVQAYWQYILVVRARVRSSF